MHTAYGKLPDPACFSTRAPSGRFWRRGARLRRMRRTRRRRILRYPARRWVRRRSPCRAARVDAVRGMLKIHGMRTAKSTAGRPIGEASVKLEIQAAETKKSAGKAKGELDKPGRTWAWGRRGTQPSAAGRRGAARPVRRAAPPRRDTAPDQQAPRDLGGGVKQDPDLRADLAQAGPECLWQVLPVPIGDPAAYSLGHVWFI